MDEDENAPGNVISLNGEPIHHSAPKGRMFSVQAVIDGMMEEDPEEVVVIARRHDGSIYIGASHNTASSSLLLGQAQHFIHSHYES